MANVPITSLPLAVAVDGSPYVEIAMNTAPIGMPASYVSKRVSMQQIANQFANNLFAEVPYVCDEGGNVLDVGNKGYLKVPFSGSLTAVELLGYSNGVGAPGSVSIDIWKCSYAQFDAGATAPTAANSICGGDYPAIVNDTKYLNSTLGLWSTGVAANDVFAYYIRSCSVFTRLTISMTVLRQVV